MKKIINIIIAITSLFILDSCSPSYHASSANVSLFRAKNEFKGNIGISPNSANVDLSYSISDNFLITAGANGFYHKESSVGNAVYKDSKGYSFTVAPGFFTYFGNKGVFEVLLGYGYNYADSEDMEGNFHKAFIQPSIGLSKPYFELAFTPRFTTLIIDQNSFLDKRKSQYDMFIEPIGTIRAGGEDVKVTTQIGFSIPTSQMNYQISPFYMNFGIQVHLRNKKAVEWPNNEDF